MTSRNRPLLGLGFLTLGLTGMACATQSASVDSGDAALRTQTQRVESLERELVQREQRIATLTRDLDAKTGPPPVSARPPGGEELFPPAAKPGECYARVFVPATYRVEEERVLRRAASTRIETTPVRMDWGEERVLVREASTQLEVVPAAYEWVEETILVKPETTRLEEVPAVYDFEEEQVLVKPAQTVWKKGRGPVEKVDHATGEILCLVEEPAVYKTVRRRVMSQPPATRTVTVPAEYEIVKKRVMKTPPTTREVEIPAEYATVKVQKVVEPAREQRVDIPAEYETLEKRIKVDDERMAWRSVLCETNMGAEIVLAIQRALSGAGYDPGPVDGVIGVQTLGAVRSYQRAKGLPTGGLTLTTLHALGVRTPRP